MDRGTTHDTRDLWREMNQLARFEENARDAVEPMDEDDAERLKALRDLFAELRLRRPQDGVALMNEEALREYAESTAEEIHGADIGHWPFNCIDWGEAMREFKHDFASVEFEGETFWFQE